MNDEWFKTQQSLDKGEQGEKKISECDNDLGCFGCLLTIIGFLGIVYIIAHLSEIWEFVIHSPFPLN